MTTDPNGGSVRDVSAHNDMQPLGRNLPVVKDINDYAVPEFFETDEEFDEFQRWLEAERQMNLAQRSMARVALDTDVTSRVIKGRLWSLALERISLRNPCGIDLGHRSPTTGGPSEASSVRTTQMS